MATINAKRIADIDTSLERGVYDNRPAERAISELIDAVQEARSQLGNGLAGRVLEMCKARDWSMHWTCRGAYLHLEASELIEALRGKRGSPLEEAADVLIVLMSITENAGIPWNDVFSTAEAKVTTMMTKPRYPGEEFATPQKL